LESDLKQLGGTSKSDSRPSRNFVRALTFLIELFT
jgi:hypothetical protein